MSFKQLDIKQEYRSLIHSIADDFLIPALNEAVAYDRAVGFFSSSALARIVEGVQGLACNNGKIRIVTSPYLAEALLSSSIAHLALHSTYGPPFVYNK